MAINHDSGQRCRIAEMAVFTLLLCRNPERHNSTFFSPNGEDLKTPVVIPLRQISDSIVASESTIAMQAHPIIKLWQAMSPVSARALMQSDGDALQPSSAGDQFVLLKLTRGQAFYAAKAVWARHFGTAVVVEMLFYQGAFTPFDVETIAYDAHREYRIPVLDLPRLSLAQVSPPRIIGSLLESMPSSLSQCSREKASIANLGRGLNKVAPAGLFQSL